MLEESVLYTMGEIMSWRESDFMHEWVDMWYVGIFIGVLLGMLTSAFLDLATRCPTFVWVAIWVMLPIVISAFPVVAVVSHPNNRIEDDSIRNTKRSYDALTKNQKTLVPN